MRSTLALIAACLSAAASAQTPGHAADWSALAQRDLQAIHDGLQANSPVAYSGPQGATYRAWLDRGLVEARAKLPKVGDERGYYYLLRGYIGGFRDSHIGIRGPDMSRLDPPPLAWPGFATVLRRAAYVVAESESPASPPAGTKLISCAGQPAAEIARKRLDRYEGDLSLASGRYTSAWKLLLDSGNPFVPPPPRNCLFEVNGKPRAFTLTFKPLAPHTLDRLKNLTAPVAGKLAATAIVPGAWWLRIPSMGENQDWDGFYRTVESHLPDIRSARLVVVDLRGNGGGDSSYANRLANLLWGKELTSAREPASGDVLWRVSPANHAFLVETVEEYKKDPGAAESLAFFSDMLRRMDEAIARHQSTFLVHDATEPPKAAPPSPMKGRVVLFTDQTCNSACLDLMDLFLRLPGTVQAGTETSADTIFMEVTRVPLPSGRAMLILGHKAYLDRARKSNQTYKPAPQNSFPGDIRDDAAVRQWVLDRFA